MRDMYSSEDDLPEVAGEDCVSDDLNHLQEDEDEEDEEAAHR